MKALGVIATTFFLVVLSTGLAQGTIEDPAVVPRDIAWARLVNVAPNADNIRIEFRPMAELTEDEATTEEVPVITPEAMTGLDYMESTGYLEITAGDYLVSLVADERVYAEHNIRFDAHTWTTLAAMGLIPPDVEVQDQPEDEFSSWLGGLFTGEDAVYDNELALHLEVISNERAVAFTANDAILRMVHAAPGTPPIELVHSDAPTDAAATTANDTTVLIDDLIYRAVSDHRTYTATQTTDHLELRLADSNVTLLDLSETDLEPGRIHTIFVTGTPVEELPIKALILSDDPPELP